MSDSLAHILIIEDNPGDVDLIKYSFKKNKIINTYDVISDGQDAVDFVFKREPFENAKTPDLIILDINLPRKSGLEILSEIKSSPKTKRIPVIILTTSKSDEDIFKAYDQFVNAYLVKPVGLDSFVEVVGTIDNFWLSIVKFPKEK